MDNFPPLTHQACPDPSPVTPPGQSFGTDKCRHGRSPDFQQLRQAFPVMRGCHVFFIPAPSIAPQFGTEIDIAKSEPSQAPFECIPLEMFEPAGGETSDVHDGLDPILPKQEYELIQAPCAGTDAVDPLPNYRLPLRAPHCLPPHYQRKWSFSPIRYRRPSFSILSLSRSPYRSLSNWLNSTRL